MRTHSAFVGDVKFFTKKKVNTPHLTANNAIKWGVFYLLKCILNFTLRNEISLFENTATPARIRGLCAIAVQ
jgi:hypothetical protein